MPALSAVLRDRILNHITGARPDAAPTATVMALYLVTPTDGTAGTEVSGPGYLRQPITWNLSVNQVATSAIAVTFTAAGGAWGSIVGAGIIDLSRGTLIAMGPLPQTQIVNNTDRLTFPAGTVNLKLP